MYVGHILTVQGLKPDPENIKAIAEMPPTTDKVGVQRLLGMVNYVAKFISKVGEKTKPLKELIHKDVDWCWLETHQRAFEMLKECVRTPPVRAYYDSKVPVRLSCDASKSSLVTICLQANRLVALTSISMTEMQQRYP